MRSRTQSGQSAGPGASCIIMGLGPALSEEIRFENGKILNPNFDEYAVPRFRDVPELDIHLLNRPDLPSVGGGETPIIAIAPAIANAVFHATGIRVRDADPLAPGAGDPILSEIDQSWTPAAPTRTCIKLSWSSPTKAASSQLPLYCRPKAPRPAKWARKRSSKPAAGSGTIGGGMVEAEAQRLAVEAIRTGRPVLFGLISKAMRLPAAVRSAADGSVAWSIQRPRNTAWPTPLQQPLGNAGNEAYC